MTPSSALRSTAGARRGMAIVFVIGMLSLLSMVAVSLAQLTSLERHVAANYALDIRARLAAESGLEYALQAVRNGAPAGPIAETVLRDWGYEFADPAAASMRDPRLRLSRETRLSGTDALAGCRIAIGEDSGKLNLNDPNDPPFATTVNDARGYAAQVLNRYDWASGRLFVMTEILFSLLLDNVDLSPRGEAAAKAVFFDPRAGRAAFADDRFPGPDALDAAFARAAIVAALTPAETARLRDAVTLHSWQDPNVLKPNGMVYGCRTTRQLRGTNAAGTNINRTAPTIGVNYDSPGIVGQPQGDLWTNLLDTPVESNLAIQSRHFELQARAPVNLNTARHELLQALLLPLIGCYLEEGPAENQSSEHYGWWSTGKGEPDRNVVNMGSLRLTKPFTPERAERLAWAMYCRIHGIVNADLVPEQQPDADGDGAPEPHPFATWEEFRHFLEHGIVNTLGNPEADRIFLGDDFVPDILREVPAWYDEARGYLDPHKSTPNGGEDQWYKDKYLNVPRALYDTYGNLTTWKTDKASDWLKRYYRQAQTDLVYANFNPNTLLNDFNPNANIYLMVDKGQLLCHTTEGCFAPTGAFTLTSQGTVTGPAGETLAQCRLAAAARLFQPLRVTSQAQFLQGLNDAARLGEYVSALRDPQNLLPEQYPHSSPGGLLTLQSYPEPLYPGMEASAAQARYDGYLMPATLQRSPAFISSNAPIATFHDIQPSGESPLNGMWLMGFDYNHNLDSTLLSVDESGFGRGVPGCLYPDGMFSERDRVLSFSMSRFFQGDGSFQCRFWIKPNFHTGISARIRKFLAGPTKNGVYARQTLMAAYYMANPCSNETRGVTNWRRRGLSNDDSDWYRLGVHDTRSFSLCGPQVGVSGGPRANGHVAHGVQYGLTARNYWLPTRCLLRGFAWQYGASRNTSFVIGTSASHTATLDFPMADGNVWGETDPLHSRQWNVIHFNASLPGSVGNASAVDASLGLARGSVWNRYRGIYDPAATYDAFSASALSGSEILRFGELPAQSPGGTALASPYAADATIDEINNVDVYGETYWQGRYYSQPFNLCEDGAGDCPTLGSYESPALDLQRELQAPGLQWILRDVAWTLYRPRHNRERNPSHVYARYNKKLSDNVLGVVVNPNDKPDPMARYWAKDAGLQEHPDWDPLSVDFLEPGATPSPEDDRWYFQHQEQYNTDDVSCLLTYPGGSRCPEPAAARYRHGDVFRYRAFFHIDKDQSLFEAPVLDDMTFTFWRGAPEILWLREE